jgi:hypothetical protein
MTYEARIAFVVFFFAVWLFFGLLAWAAVAVIRRGRGALPALPLALAAAAVGGVLVPLLGFRDATGFAVSLGTATIGGLLGAIAGVVLAQRMGLAPPPPEATVRPERESAEVPAQTDAP